MVLLHVFDDTDDRNVYLDLTAASESEVHADGITAAQLIDERDAALRVVAIESGCDRKGDYILGSKPKIEVTQVPQSANEQRRTCEKQHRESDLSRNQHLTKTNVRNAGRGG